MAFFFRENTRRARVCPPQKKSLPWRAVSGVARAKLFSEEVAFVPSRHGVLLGNFITNQEVDCRGFGSRRVVEDLIHVVERGVIFRHHPFLLYLESRR